MDDSIEFLRSMMQVLEIQMRKRMVGEIEAFVNDYHHHVDGRDVVIVDQLLDFLRGPSDDLK
jgi:hypothetical protein